MIDKTMLYRELLLADNRPAKSSEQGGKKHSKSRGYMQSEGTLYKVGTTM